MQSDRDDAPAGAEALHLLVVNARVPTGDPRRPWADAVWCTGGSVRAVGASAALRKRVPPATTVLDAGGAEATALAGAAGTLALRSGGVADFRLVGVARVLAGRVIPDDDPRGGAGAPPAADDAPPAQ